MPLLRLQGLLLQHEVLGERAGAAVHLGDARWLRHAHGVQPSRHAP